MEIDLLKDGGRIIGIDPGSTTGLVCVDVGRDLAIDGMKWVGGATVTFSDAKRTPPERDLHFMRQIENRLMEWDMEKNVHHIALEEPVDARASWALQKEGRHEKTGTSFRLGVSYAMAVAASGADTLAPRCVQSYPVKKYGSRKGWMRGTKLFVIEHTRMIARSIGAQANDLSEHELMALGVLVHHVNQIGVWRMEAQIQTELSLKKPRRRKVTSETRE